jgi:hypothetical protein
METGNMRKSPIHLALLALAVAAVGCSVAARDANMYAQDTQKVLESRNGAIKACYDQQLKTDKSVAGTVTVKFTVKTETGDLTDIKVDPAGTTAPEALSQCVVTSIQGLKLTPPDSQEGLATYSWSFQVGAPAAGPTPAVPATPPAANAAPAAPATGASSSASLQAGGSGLIGPTRAK